MRKMGLLGTSALGSAAFVALSLALAGTSLAQVTTAPPGGNDPGQLDTEVELESGEVADTEQEIQVTGTRIRTPNLTSTVPVTSIGQEQFTQTGQVSIGDVLNDLPALRSTFSTANSTRFIGTTGLNILDLRGLGTARTLVLVNGRRHVGATEGETGVDTNTIPTDLLERVDVVTGGSTAVYGSDAVAGVVNFILRDDFEGITGRAGSAISDEGDGASYFLSLTAGTNFGPDDRGNIAVSGEFARQSQIQIDQRRETRGGRRQFQVVDSDVDPSSDENPDRIFLGGIRNGALSESGTFQGICPAAVPATNPAFADTERRRAINCSATNQPNFFRFGPDGLIRPAVAPTRDFRPLSGNQQDGDGSNLRRYGQLVPQVERYILNVLGKYEISDAFQPYFEAKYARVDSVQEGSPSFAQGGSTTDPVFTARTRAATATVPASAEGFNSIGIPIRFDNAFLTPESRGFIQSALPAGRTFFRLNRNNLDVGVRGEEGKRETYRGVIGVRGDFNTDWNYDVSANYGRVENRVFSLNNRIQQRFELATDAVRAPDGRIVCRSQLPGQVTPPSGNSDTTRAVNAAQLASDIAACVPINLFGENNVTQAARDYVNTTTQFDGENEQFDVLGFVSGDLSQLFELPGGPIGFVVGGEYRREDAASTFGEVTRSGRTFLNAIPDFAPPEALEVKEAFAELNVPIIRDSFIHELSLNAAGRVSDYNTDVGTVYTYSLGGTFAPVRDVRFRANFSRAIRAPTLSDLFSANTQNFASVADPCDITNIGAGSATRAANCRAAGIPADFQNLEARAATIEILSGGNPALLEETADSLTVGVVLTPRFIPGFSLTVDYFDIDIDDVIESVAAQDILNNCFDAASLDNQFCPLIFRDPNTFFFQRPGVLQTSLNFARRTTKGVDIDASYRRDLGFGKLSLRGIATYIDERNNFEDLNDPTRADQVLRELGDPRWAANFNADLTIGGLTIGYELRFLEAQVTNAAEDIFSVQGRAPENPDYSDPSFYPDVYYHDIRVAYDINDRFTFYGGVDNISDRLPPLGLTGTGGGSGIYDVFGRRFFVGAKATF